MGGRSRWDRGWRSLRPGGALYLIAPGEQIMWMDSYPLMVWDTGCGFRNRSWSGRQAISVGPSCCGLVAPSSQAWPARRADDQPIWSTFATRARPKASWGRFCPPRCLSPFSRCVPPRKVVPRALWKEVGIPPFDGDVPLRLLRCAPRVVEWECWQSAQVGQIRTREDYYYEELRGSSLRVLL